MLIQWVWDRAWEFVFNKFSAKKSGKSLHWCPLENQRQGSFAQRYTVSHPSPPCLLPPASCPSEHVQRGLCPDGWPAGTVVGGGGFLCRGASTEVCRVLLCVVHQETGWRVRWVSAAWPGWSFKQGLASL